MNDFALGLSSSVAATVFIAVVVEWVWPALKARVYSGIKVDGKWEIVEERNGRNVTVGTIELRQSGSVITGTSTRRKTREGKTSDRKFKYKGTIHDDQVALMFDDAKGSGFDTGSYVFIVQNDCVTMLGNATFHGRTENKIVSEPRILKKIAS